MIPLPFDAAPGVASAEGGSGDHERVSLYQRYRSLTFSEVAGQQAVTQTLRNAVQYGKVSHAYLFTGPRGTGKTSTARILARAVNCLDPQQGEPCNRCSVCVSMLERRSLDLVEIDGASNNSVDDVRELVARINFRPAEARKKVFIIDEVHMLSIGAFNALLKTLEEPPEHLLFLMATTELHKVPATITSRCQVFSLKQIALPEMVGRLRYICGREGVSAGDDVLTFIARQVDGSLRDALSLLEQIRAYCGDRLELREVEVALGLARVEQVAVLAEAMAGGDVATSLLTVGELMDNGMDPRQLARQLTSYWSEALYGRARGKPVAEPSVAALNSDAITTVLRSLLLVESAARRSDSPRWALELAVAEATLGLAAQGGVTPTRREPRGRDLAAADATSPRTAVPRLSEPASTFTTPAAAQVSVEVLPHADPAPQPEAREREAAPELSAAPVHGDSDAPLPGSDEALARWPMVLRWLREQRKGASLQAALATGVIRVDGSIIEVGFGPASGFHQRIMEQASNRQTLEQAVAVVYGGQWTVRCATIEGLAPPPSPEDFESYASGLEREARAQRGTL